MILILSISLITFMFSSTKTDSAPETEFTISNPYGTVDWVNYSQYKANFHSHTTESGGENQPAEMIEDHYAKGYDILAFTDHDFTSTTWDRTDRPDDIEYLTSGRLAEIKAGAGRNSRGMIGIPYSNEQSISDHLNTFWANYTNVSGATLESKIAQAESLGGISHINHPGKYTGGVSTADGGADGAAASSDPDTVAYYTNLFEKYSSCVGMEIINKKDYDSYSDRILWDNILKQTMPERPVWGFSNDDSHSVSATGFSFNMLLLPENNLGNVRQAMEKGIFYAVARVAKRELGSSFIGSGPTPAITNIAVNETEDSITITGTNYNKVEWVADGKVIATGTSIDLDNYADLISTYVRAQLKGAGGISFTQPFGVTRLDTEAALVNKDAYDPLNVKVKTTRYAGTDRFETAVAVSQAGWEKADTVVIARSDDFADALAGVPLAYKLNAPILLTYSADLPDIDVTEIRRLQAAKAVILGESGAVSEDVAAEITSLGLQAERIGGMDRFGTAAKIADLVITSEITTAAIVNGYDFPDALAAASYAAVKGYPILMAETNNIPADTASALAKLSIKNVFVIGLSGAISQQVMDRLPAPVRYGGEDRYATAVELARHFVPSAGEIFLATGCDYPDALAGAVLAAKHNSGVLYVPGDRESAPYADAGILQFITDSKVTAIHVLGGPGVINDVTVSSLGTFPE